MLTARDQLTAAYPQMDTAKLEQLLARMFFIAMIQGRLSADDELSGNA